MQSLQAAFNSTTVLLACPFAVATLLALWAGLSRRHWCLRLLVVAVAGGGVLAARVYEGVVYLALHCLSTFLVLVAFRAIQQRLRPQAPTADSTPVAGARWRFRFRLLDLLLLNVVIAAFASQLGYAVFQPAIWSDVIATALSATGLACGLAWLSSARRRLVIPVVMTLLASLLHTRVWSWCDWLDFVLLSGAAAQASLLGLYAAPLWGFVGSQVGLLFSVTILYRLASRRPSGSVAEEGRRVSSQRLRGARIALALFGACLVVPTLLLAWGLSRPLPPIENTPEGPNCYPDLVRFAASINAATIPDVSTAPAAVLQAYAQQQAATVVRLRPLLERPSCVLLDYSPAGATALVSPAMQDFRTAASWLQACGRGETLAGRTSEAAVIYLDLVRLSGQVSRGGLVCYQLVGNTMEGMGSEGLSAIRAELSVQQLRDVRRTLLEINARREPHAAVRRRDDTWFWRVYGWSARLSTLLESPLPSWFTSTRPAPPDLAARVDAARRAQLALLVTDLALREFHLDRRSYPASLSELVPDYLPSPPLDPFSGQSLHYRQHNETYVLYSIGPNQTNDGGQAVTWPDLIGGQGDLLLDSPDSLAAQRKAKPGPSPTDGR